MVPSGLAALAAAPAPPSPEAAAAWPALAEALENFLLGAAYLEASGGGAGALRASLSSLSAAQAELQRRHTALPRVPVLDVPRAAPPPPPPRGRGLRRGKHQSSGGSAEELHAGGGADPATAAPIPAVIDAAQARADADLELAVLDCLTDEVLTACGPAPTALKERLIGVVARGIARPPALSVPQLATGSNFGHVCIRKMYVLCSRGAGPVGAAPGAGGAALEVARLALPPFVARCAAMLRAFADEARPGALGGAAAPPLPRPLLDEVMCVLEVLASMSLAPAVADAALPPEGPAAAVVAALRAAPGAAARGRERTHLLLLYPALCGCITCREPRVREMVRDVLGLAGAELGL